MRYYDTIDLYCERMDATLLAEPLNVISNAAFLIAAWMLWRLRRDTPPNHSTPLIALLVLIGLGSASFHLFANKLTMLLDVIPITLFVFAYLWIALTSVVGLRWQAALAGMALFSLVAMLSGTMPAPYRLNGSITYVPCLLTIALLSAILWKNNRPAARLIALASLLFAASLTFRSIDRWVCPTLLFGTHMFWHVLNGFTLYYLTKAVMFHSPPPKN